MDTAVEPCAVHCASAPAVPARPAERLSAHKRLQEALTEHEAELAAAVTTATSDMVHASSLADAQVKRGTLDCEHCILSERCNVPNPLRHPLYVVVGTLRLAMSGCCEACVCCRLDVIRCRAC